MRENLDELCPVEDATAYTGYEVEDATEIDRAEAFCASRYASTARCSKGGRRLRAARLLPPHPFLCTMSCANEAH